MEDSKREYWNDVAHEFDTFYREEKRALRRVVDKIFRKNMVERFSLTLQECRNVDGKKILDVGCGSGRMMIELARKGAHVAGIDLSENMLQIATAMTQKLDLNRNCEFIHDDFLRHSFTKNFDISIALGLFDYTKDPIQYLRKMESITSGKCIFSFPSKFAFQVPLRMIWLKARNFPVYFYTKKELKRLFRPIFPRFKIKNISAGYFCVAYVSDRRQ